MTTFKKILKPRQTCDLELLLDGSFAPLEISGTEQRALLRAGKPLHEWSTFPEIMEELQREFS